MKKILDIITEELNNSISEEEKKKGVKFERLHSEQYEIITTKDGKFYNPKNK